MVNPFKKIAIFFCISSFALNAQSLLFPGDYFFDLHRQREALKDTSSYPLHLSMQPFIYTIDPKIDTFNYYIEDAGRSGRRLLFENLIRVNVKDPRAGNANFKLSIDPVFNFQGGSDISATKLEKIYTNSRGAWVKGSINEKIKFESAFFENQSTFASYVDDFAISTGVVPGQGRYKNFKLNGYDYAFASGVISYEASRNFSIQAGHGKQKTGNGYRSLLLSDNAMNYPFVRFNSRFFKGRVQYTNIYASLMNLTSGGAKTPPGTERLFQKKAAAFQQLSWQIHKRVNLSFFQGMIWNASDSSNRQHIDPGYVNPVIFTHAAAYGLHGKNNIVLGADLQVKLFKSLALYGQLMLDDLDSVKISNSKAGFQLGMKYYDVFTLKNLFVQAELNSIRNYPYLSAYPSQDYAHYNQGLAYPFSLYRGNEIVLILAYNYKRFFGQFKVNLFTNETEFTHQQLAFGDFKAGFMINPKTNTNICAGVNYRDSSIKNDNTGSTSVAFNTLVYFSLRTSLYNVYWDF
ncbi:MAG: hypothetical protein ACJ76F_11475 [Bacteroidia bacterium]